MAKKRKRPTSPNPPRTKGQGKNGTPTGSPAKTYPQRNRSTAKASLQRKVTVVAATPPVRPNCRGGRVNALQSHVTLTSPKTKTVAQLKGFTALSEAKALAQVIRRSTRGKAGPKSGDGPKTRILDTDVPELATRSVSSASARNQGRPNPFGVVAAFGNNKQRKAADATNSPTTKFNDNATIDDNISSPVVMPKAANPDPLGVVASSSNNTQQHATVAAPVLQNPTIMKPVNFRMAPSLTHPYCLWTQSVVPPYDGEFHSASCWCVTIVDVVGYLFCF